MDMIQTPVATAPTAALPDARALAAENQRQEAAQKFESMLIGELSNLMFSTVETDGPFGGGHAEGIYRGMMAEHVGTAIAKRGGLGLVPALDAELLALQKGR
mgnify:CR=1 FL=1